MKIFLSTGAPGNSDWLVSLWKMTYILMIRLRTGELLGGVFPWNMIHEFLSYLIPWFQSTNQY